MATDTNNDEIVNRINEYRPTLVGSINLVGSFALVLAGVVLYSLLFITVYEVMDMAGALDSDGATVLIATLRFAFEVPVGAALGVFASIVYSINTSRSSQPKTGAAVGALITALGVVASVYVPWIGSGMLP